MTPHPVPCPSADDREQWALEQMGIDMGDVLRMDRHNRVQYLRRKRDEALHAVAAIDAARPVLLANVLLTGSLEHADEDAAAQDRKARLVQFIGMFDLALPAMWAMLEDIGVPQALERRARREAHRSSRRAPALVPQQVTHRPKRKPA
jgi:hypothetical protein